MSGASFNHTVHILYACTYSFDTSVSKGKSNKIVFKERDEVVSDSAQEPNSEPSVIMYSEIFWG